MRSCSTTRRDRVVPGNGGVFAGATSGTSQVSDLSCYGGSAPEKVYEWTPDVSGWAQVSTCGSSYDTVLFVRDGGCAGADLACNNIGYGYCNGFGSHVIVEVTAGHPYAIVVDGYNSTDHGNFTLTITPAGSDVRRISAKKLLIKDNADATKRKIIFLSKDVNLDTTGAGTAVDPSTYGADFHVYNANGGSDSACLPLPNPWAHSGTGFKYKDSQFVHGPCKVAKIKDRSLLKVVCLAKVKPIDYTLDEMTQGAVGVRFTVGTVVYCAELGGTVKKDSGTDPPITGGTGQFAAKDAPAPLTCPTPPSPCP